MFTELGSFESMFFRIYPQTIRKIKFQNQPHCMHSAFMRQLKLTFTSLCGVFSLNLFENATISLNDSALKCKWFDFAWGFSLCSYFALNMNSRFMISLNTSQHTLAENWRGSVGIVSDFICDDDRNHQIMNVIRRFEKENNAKSEHTKLSCLFETVAHVFFFQVFTQIMLWKRFHSKINVSIFDTDGWQSFFCLLWE